MKQIIFLITVGLSSLMLQAQDKQIPFMLSGKIDDVGQPAKVILMYARDGKRVSDTTDLNAGEFSIKGMINKPMRAIIIVVKSSDNPRMAMAMGYAGEIIGRDGIPFYLDKGKINIKGKTLKDAVITGSPSQKDFELYQSLTKPVTDKLTSINEQMRPYATDREGDTYKTMMQTLLKTMKETGPISNEFIKSHPNSWVAWDRLTGQSIISDPKGAQKLFDGMKSSFRKSEDGIKFQERLLKSMALANGSAAPNFSQDNVEGKLVSLASFKGKYVLIDFWASWCGPCRAENPNVKAVYEKFKGKNFEIVAVSLDSKKDNWVKAINDDGLPWIHVSDLKGWENEVAKLYTVRAVPQNWLLDPNGVIIAANMRGKDLDEKLSEVLQGK